MAAMVYTTTWPLATTTITPITPPHTITLATTQTAVAATAIKGKCHVKKPSAFFRQIKLAFVFSSSVNLTTVSRATAAF